MQHQAGCTGREGRRPAAINAVVQRPDGRRIPVKISNFSDQGCRFETRESFRIGERFQIAVPRMGNLKAQVRWSLPGAAGTRFLTELDF